MAPLIIRLDDLEHARHSHEFVGAEHGDVPEMIDDRIRRALSRGHTVDITTTGRQSGKPRRIEVVFHNFDGRLYISGMPRRERRSWLANLDADPTMTFHLKGPVKADLPARARILTDPTERETVLRRIAQAWRRTDVDTMVRWSPLIEVEIEGLGVGRSALVP